MAKQGRNMVRGVKRQHLGFPIAPSASSQSYSMVQAGEAKDEVLQGIQSQTVERGAPFSPRDAAAAEYRTRTTRRYESWQLKDSEIPITVGLSLNPIPFDRCVIGGKHGKLRSDIVTNPVWLFSPSPDFQGVLQVSAHVEFKAVSADNFDSVALEVWKYKYGYGHTFWRQLDKISVETVGQSEFSMAWALTHSILNGQTLVNVGCGESFYLALKTRGNGATTLTYVSGLYGYVDVTWEGCTEEVFFSEPNNTLCPDY